MTPVRTIVADRIVTAENEWSPGYLKLDGEKIVGAGESEQLGVNSEYVSGTLIPGFVDMHVHGALGVDFGSARSEAEVRKAAAYHHSLGSTTVVASVATSALHSMAAAARRLAPSVESGDLAGIHLEGPFLAPTRRGAHRQDLLRVPDLRELDDLIEAGGGAIIMVTIAPELPGALKLIDRLVECDIVAAIGHSDCDADTARAALDSGARVVTHLYNGMRPFHHRDPGLAGVALSDSRAVVELILDRFHLTGEAQTIALNSARGRVAVISDAMQAAGCPDGVYRIAGSVVQVTDGAAWLADGSSIAGSTSTASNGFHTLRTVLNRSLREAIEATASTPARILGLESRSFAVGENADLLVVNREGTEVVRVMRRGRWLTS
ncbi:N-acetylglucosamine-6-phosphate deacetylase [Subtercola lobariae]|uniref:N-acetylglucosamine-6-phosphate deacetylase n=1 Tax=Subtercola lobariae TaxID=1588641 RepID=A0A917B0W4_9MICO|nr:amidohydrolase family protein [Subtercola lobariae]GGF10448.1 N-acetylglucosamine-6-phosphate deacetylase [Subtercola lobariae]